MKTKTKKTAINHTIIRSKSVYSSPELASIMGVTQVTIRNWIKQGMKVLDKNSNPYLILGSDARQFIICRKERHRKPTKIDEFFCPRCKAPRKSIPEYTIAKYTGKQFKTSPQVIIQGICADCSCRLRYFSSEQHLKILIDSGMKIQEGSNILMSNSIPSLILSSERK